MTPPIRFVFGLHLHQPVGNFDYVFQQHLDDVYLPFLKAVEERQFGPIVVHCSGPLLDWLEQHGGHWLDQLGRMAADGRVELLLAGYYEPILAALPREDRLEQINWMREALMRRFGVAAQGLWLTERVWEPDLAADLADAGVGAVLVDDHHFRVSGFEPEQLHRPWTTEHAGRRLTLVPIDERLRYLIPFQPPADTAEYLRRLRAEGQPLAVLADDGEKFGGWPGTREWVYDRGWLAQFLTTVGHCIEQGEVQLSTLAGAVSAVPSGGLAYLPTASYREMESWALPPRAARRLQSLERELGDRGQGAAGALLRGSHWRNFLAKYSEANRLHKKMQALSRLCRARGNPPEVRRAIGRAQCNDAYWHGVFGGLYLPFLRAALWRELAFAEAVLRAAEPLTHEVLDLDLDGREELWIHGPACSVLIAPHRGGAIEEYTLLHDGVNYADVLTRREEAYHQDGVTDLPTAHHGSAESHGLGNPPGPNGWPARDRDDRVLLTERMLDGGLTEAAYAIGDYTPAWQIRQEEVTWRVAQQVGELAVIIIASRNGAPYFQKRITIAATGGLRVDYQWDPSAFPVGAWFAPELSLAATLPLTTAPAGEIWAYDITTLAKSERGFDQTLQGRSLTSRWPVALGSASLELGR